MKVAYIALVALTLIVGTRFAREFTSAVRASREDTLQDATNVATELTRVETSGADLRVVGIQPSPDRLLEQRYQQVVEPAKDGSATTVPPRRFRSL